ncbi:hypothetical protein GX51_01668 [Blastomyces parvus]|uniref:Uncharacterized protein n=1 Tax=Blastomyces parvus TaxID=2060905 RepID=A0A2B7XFF7_9EURO|nr:hypothetical protein GX51_01668 [Blastomyces parvus]
MKLTTLFTSACLIAAAIASPVTQLKSVDVDVDVDALSQPPNPANIDMHEINFSPPYNWRPDPRLLDWVRFNRPPGSTQAEFINFLKNHCMNIPRCRSLAGFKEDEKWVGYIFKITLLQNDFVRDPRISESFAFTT